jgi:hypothetical protein
MNIAAARCIPVVPNVPVIDSVSITDGGGQGLLTVTFNSGDPDGQNVRIAGYIDRPGDENPADGVTVAAGVGAEATFTSDTTVGATNVPVPITGTLDGIYDVFVAASYDRGLTWSDPILVAGVPFDTTPLLSSGLQINGAGIFEGSSVTTDPAVSGDMIVALVFTGGTNIAQSMSGFSTDDTNLRSARDNGNAQLFYRKLTSNAPSGVTLNPGPDSAKEICWFNLGNADFFSGAKDDSGYGSVAKPFPVLSEVPAGSLLVYFHARRSTSDSSVIDGHGATLVERPNLPSDSGQWSEADGKFLVDVIQSGGREGDSPSGVVHRPSAILQHRGGVVAAFNPA